MTEWKHEPCQRHGHLHCVTCMNYLPPKHLRDATPADSAQPAGPLTLTTDTQEPAAVTAIRSMPWGFLVECKGRLPYKFKGERADIRLSFATPAPVAADTLTDEQLGEFAQRFGAHLTLIKSADGPLQLSHIGFLPDQFRAALASPARAIPAQEALTDDELLDEFTRRSERLVALARQRAILAARNAQGETNG